MALTKTAKIWIIVVSTPVVLLIACAIAAKMYFTSDRLKALVVPRIEQATHRTVAIEDISLSVFPSIAVSIDHLKISNPVGSTFEKNEFISLDNLQLKVKILELLRSNLEIEYVIVNHPVVYMEITKDGRNNYSGSQASGKKTTDVAVKTDNTTALVLSNLEINDGEIEQVDKKFDVHMLVKGFHQTASVEAPRGEQTFLINGTSSVESFSYGSLSSWYLRDQPITAQEKISYRINDDVLSFDAVTAKIRELPLGISGSISRLTKPELMMDLTVSSPGAQMAELLSILPPEMVKKASGLSSSGDFKFTMKVKGPSSELMNPGIEGSFTVTNGKVQYASLPKSITNITVSGDFEEPPAPIGKKDIGSFSLDRFSATLGTSDLNGKLKVTNFGDPGVTATFGGLLNLGEVKEYYPLEEGTELAGMMKANVSLDGKAKMPQSIKASGQIEFQNVSIKKASSPPLQNLNGTITFNNQLVESKQLSLKVGESDLNLGFALHNYLGMVIKDTTKSTGGKPTATVTLTSKQLRTADLMPQGGSKEAPPAAQEKKASGNKGAGLLPGVDVDANVSVDKLVTEKFTFNNAHGAVAVSDGIVNLKNFAVNAFQGTIQSKGTLDLRDPAKLPFNLDLDIKSVESNELLPSFTSFGKYLFGKFSTTTKLQGDLDDTLGLNRQTLLGGGKVEILDGKLLGYPLTEKLSEFTGVNELRAVNFKDWTNAFSISNGRLNVKDLKVNAGQTGFLVEGSQGLDGSLDYNLTVKLPQALSSKLQMQGVAGQVLDYLKDKDGKLNLSFLVGGSASSPSLRLDPKAQEEAAKRALESKVAGEKTKVEDDLKKKAADALKNLFKKP